MSDNNIGIFGLTRQYPEFKYSTKEMIDILGNKLTEKVKENILQLGCRKQIFHKTIRSVTLANQVNKLNQFMMESLSQIYVKMLQKNVYRI